MKIAGHSLLLEMLSPLGCCESTTSGFHPTRTLNVGVAQLCSHSFVLVSFQLTLFPYMISSIPIGWPNNSSISISAQTTLLSLQIHIPSCADIHWDVSYASQIQHIQTEILEIPSQNG